MARWNGQTVGQHGFSVAQHSIVVEEIAAHIRPDLEPRWRLAALLHDAAEYVIGDMISPFKAALGLSYAAFEARLEHAIHLRFGLPAEPPARVKALIKQADRASAFFEATQLAGFTPTEALSLFGAAPKGYLTALETWSTADAQARYLARFRPALRSGRICTKGSGVRYRLDDPDRLFAGADAGRGACASPVAPSHAD